MAQKETTTELYERELEKIGSELYVLRLYITGATPASSRAIANLKALCDGRLKGRYQLEVVDIFQHPQLAQNAEIIAAPTLVKQLPPPLRRFVGDLSDLEDKLLGLEVVPARLPSAKVAGKDRNDAG